MIADERRAQVAAWSGGGVATGLAGLVQVFDELGEGLRARFDDPMNGILTGPLQRAVAGVGTGLVAALDHACMLTPVRAEAAIDAYTGLFLRARRSLVAAALRLAEVLPSFSAEDIRADRDLFAWWRERWTVPVRIELADGATINVHLPDGVPAPLASGIGRMLRALSTAARDAGELLGHPGRQARGLIEAMAIELNEGLVGLLVNGRGRGCRTSPRTISTALAPSGTLPTRAAWCKDVTLAGAPFHDALGRYFAAPHTAVRLPRTGQRVVVWRSGTCPFPDIGVMAASGDAAHPAWLPPSTRQ